ncbi:MAG: 50S ribosomal protein L29, partial [Candidatus Saccharibacteria bacterium]|nr:50S ribosomal protein L29 [Candidatus Saccharibacteria bacterium]
MAETKTTKKTVKKADVKKDAKAVKKSTADLMNDLRALTSAELNAALVEAKKDLVKAQKMLKANELPASHVIRQMRAKIARIHT